MHVCLSSCKSFMTQTISPLSGEATWSRSSMTSHQTLIITQPLSHPDTNSRLLGVARDNPQPEGHLPLYTILPEDLFWKEDGNKMWTNTFPPVASRGDHHVYKPICCSHPLNRVLGNIYRSNPPKVPVSHDIHHHSDAEIDAEIEEDYLNFPPQVIQPNGVLTHLLSSLSL